MGLFSDNGYYLVFNTLVDATIANDQIHANMVRRAAAEGWLYHKDTGAVVAPGDLPVDDGELVPMQWPLIGVRNGVPVPFPEGCNTGYGPIWQRDTDGKYVLRKPTADLMTNVGGTVELFDPSWEGAVP